MKINKALFLLWVSLIFFLQQSQCFLRKEIIHTNLLSQSDYDPTKNCLQAKKQPSDFMDSLIFDIENILSTLQTLLIKQIQNKLDQPGIHLTSDQVVSILDQITIVNNKQKVLDVISSKFDSLSTQDVVDIMNPKSENQTKINLLQSLTDYLYFNNEDATQYMLQNIGFSSAQQQKARDILLNIKPKNCIFGEIKSKVVGFLLDASGSMTYQFKLPNGQSISRIDYAKQQQADTLDTLTEQQQFGIISYNSYTESFKREVIQATKENIDEAKKWIYGRNPMGSTDLGIALDFAFRNFIGLETLYIFSDGLSDYTTSQIKQKLVQLNEDKNPHVQINAVCFMAGGEETQSQREQARKQLKDISESNNGNFKDLSNID